MKKTLILMLMLTMVIIPASGNALPGIDIEAAVGGWMQSPSGDLSYVTGVPGVNDTIDLENDLKYDGKFSPSGRIKVDLPIVPSIYLVAAPMAFDGNGSKTLGFTFGDKTVTASIPFYSKLTLNQYDIGLYYGIPFLKTATMDKLNVDFGINARIMDVKAEIRQDATSISESKAVTLPVPMVYLAVQFQPIERFALEAEARGISIGDNKIFSLTGRLRVKVAGPMFAAAGYRYDKIEIDEDNVIVDTTFSGPFLEAGVKF